MRGEFIHQIYIADGFEDDCDSLIQRCLQTEKLNYETFCEIWKDMKFDSLYVGRTSAVEIMELSEELIHTAKKFLINNVSNFEESAASLFLVYGLLNLQPFKDFAVLRLDPSDVPIIKRLEMIARRDKRHDVLYILGAILIKHSQFHAEQRERGIEGVFKRYMSAPMGIFGEGLRPRGVFRRQPEERELARELAALTDRYEAAKGAVTGGRPDPSLSFINKKLPGELEASLKRLISGIPEVDEDDEIDAADVHYSRVHKIKEKAMKKSVGMMRHLTSATESTSNQPKSKVEPEIKSKPGKVKISSPTKTFSPKKGTKRASPNPSPRSRTKGFIPQDITSKPPVKRKKRSRRSKAKTPKNIAGDSSSDSDVDLTDLGNDTSEDETDPYTLDKPSEEAEITEIEIDNLPTNIHTEGNSTVYEIEFIDKFDKPNVDSNVSDTSNVVDAVEEVDKPSTSNAVFKKPKGRVRPKKPTKSLNQMGIMPMSEENRMQTRQTRSSTS